MKKRWISKILAVLLSGALLCLAGCKNTGAPKSTDDTSVSDTANDTVLKDSKECDTYRDTEQQETGNVMQEQSDPKTEEEPRTEQSEKASNLTMESNKSEVDESEEDVIEERISEILAEMSLREKVTLLLMPAMRSFREGGITEGNGGLSDAQLQVIREYHFGGIILFQENCLTARQARAFTDAAERANREGGAVSGLLMATDQEGGYVTRLAKGTSMPGNMALAATGDPENAFFG